MGVAPRVRFLRAPLRLCVSAVGTAPPVCATRRAASRPPVLEPQRRRDAEARREEPGTSAIGHPHEPTRGQATLEYVITAGTIILPITFALVFTAQLLWIWHSVVDFTREGAHYAATHCWQGGENVTNWMKSHVPPMVDMDQFQNGEAEIVVQYFARDPASGALNEFTCDAGDCSVLCMPDLVTVSVRNYQYRKFMTYLGLPAVTIPDFRTSASMESAGCNADAGETTCVE